MIIGRLPTNTVQTGLVRLNGHKKRLSYGKAVRFLACNPYGCNVSIIINILNSLQILL